MTIVTRRTAWLVVLIVFGSALGARAQERELVPLRVQIVVSTYDGQELISSLPYALSVTANAGPAQIRMGAEVPIASVQGPGVPTVNYRNVGTNIDCAALSRDDDVFQLNVTIEDTAARIDDRATPEQLRPTAAFGVFRNFRSSNQLMLRDGETQQFTAAADRVTGEVVRVDVTLSVLD